MGEGADAMLDCMMNDDFGLGGKAELFYLLGRLESEIGKRNKAYLDEFKLNLKKKVWVTKDKRSIKIKDMDTTHIRNTINLLCRCIEEDNHAGDMEIIRLAYIKLMRKQLNKRYKKIQSQWDTDRG